MIWSISSSVGPPSSGGGTTAPSAAAANCRNASTTRFQSLSPASVLLVEAFAHPGAPTDGVVAVAAIPLSMLAVTGDSSGGSFGSPL